LTVGDGAMNQTHALQIVQETPDCYEPSFVPAAVAPFESE
jgi:hypothetical protein